MSELRKLSPLETVTRQALGLSTIVGSEAFGPKMLARALRLVEDDNASPEFRQRLLSHLAKALDGSDKLCRVDVKRIGRRGQPGNGGLLASDRAFAIALEVRERRQLREPLATIRRSIEDRLSISKTQFDKDLKAGDAVIKRLDAFRARRSANRPS